MVNVTITLDEDTLRRVRIHALQHDTSLNALVRSYLESLVASSGPSEAARRLIARSERVSASSGRAGRTWTREGLYD